MNQATAILWFRQDLRLEDNPALMAAVDHKGPVVPVFIWSPEDSGVWPPGAASRWWLHQSLEALASQLSAKGSRLILRSGPHQETLDALIAETKASAIFWNRLYEPESAKRDQKIEASMQKRVSLVGTFNGSLLFEPEDIHTQQGAPYRVFTPFWKSCLNLEPPRQPLPAPKRIPIPTSWPNSVNLESFGLEPKIDWAAGLRESWKPGEQGAEQKRIQFLKSPLSVYKKQRDFPHLQGTSELSPHLHFGEISPWQIWHAVSDVAGEDRRTSAGQSGQTYQTELGWREFSHHVLHHFPHTSNQPLNEKFREFPWKKSLAHRKAWQQGQTGIPIVDAGMRQLWKTGWMHNRVRMIVASFLTKDLRLHWLEGAKWFWETLVDADLANNTMGWQWSSGSGADAAPYFRIFNPITQGAKFDAEGDYVRRYVPELQLLPAKWIHEPWKASASVLKSANVELGKTYPEPIVDHAAARKEALAAFEQIKKS